MIKTEKGTETEKTKWKTSFNLMQKELTDAQKANCFGGKRCIKD